ncbi:amidohydrolase family protein [Cryptosporangium aurantiacum]|uniref:Predicted metal-dependent hydrolase, TIM-barrel fold n=1 Tax=Cryptosporangium aurantiacum TaxID=134849 RepID=A0A1M7Q132_9ACTN|nr:amidohydrolase family protein [Cryptosporangium aurantiacum]SHN23739.1 Predicted metal-dependent hydrolase, TIM-barrel fold [Cryptosporangium aurantiacum]
MRIEDMTLISIDDHVVEPPDMFEGHLPEELKDAAPKCIKDEKGIDNWVFQGASMGPMGLNAVVSWPAEEWGMDPAGYAEMRPGAYDIHSRVRDMDRNGILASMCFPTFAGFSAGFFQKAPDKDLAFRMLQAYNDWHVDEWCAAYPGRMIPIGIAPVWNQEQMVSEIHRLSAKGVRAVTMPELPHLQGVPSYHDMDYWGPVFQACSDTGTVMCLHIGAGLGALRLTPGAPIDNMIILATQVSVLAAQDLLWGPAMRTFPDLKIAWSEAGIGWIPFYLDRSDRHYTNQRWLRRDFGGSLPSEVFKAHSLACYVTDPAALKNRHEIGIETIAWECDYPHSDSIFPNAPEFVLNEMNNAGVSDDEINMITWQNSARFFGWDPFKHISKSDATVGALRATATDVDVTIRPRAEWKKMYEAAH